MMVAHTADDRASAGGLAGFFMLVVITGIFIVILGPMVDTLTNTNNAMTSTTGLPMSQERLDTIQLLGIGFSLIGILVLLAAGINYWVNSIREQNMEV